jgi:hypothetical protein
MPRQFSRYCSGFLAGREHGFDRPIYLTNEEENAAANSFDGRGGQSVAIFDGELHTLPALGHAAKENSVVQPGRGTRTVIFPMEDGPPTLDNQLYMYVGRKDRTRGATVLERNGLVDGRLYVFRSLDPARNSERTFTSGSVTGEWVELPSAEHLTDVQLEAGADAAGAMTFVRPEDAVFNPRNRNELLFDTTGSSSGADDGVNELGRLYSLRLHPGNPLKPARLSIVYNADAVVAAGGDIAISPDNLDASRRYLMINEDGVTESRAVMAAKGRDGSIWRSARPRRRAGRARGLGEQRHHHGRRHVRSRHLDLRRPGAPADDRAGRPDGHGRGRPAVPDAPRRVAPAQKDGQPASGPLRRARRRPAGPLRQAEPLRRDAQHRDRGAIRGRRRGAIEPVGAGDLPHASRRVSCAACLPRPDTFRWRRAGGRLLFGRGDVAGSVEDDRGGAARAAGSGAGAAGRARAPQRAGARGGAGEGPGRVSRAPDLVQPVVGFRKWRIVGDHLSSPYIPLRWDEPVVHARCYPANRVLLFGEGWLDEPHDAPHPSCRCGVYAWHALPAAGPIPDPDRVFGVVALWGRLEVHEDGMRAEHAAIRALGLAPDLGEQHRRTLRAIGEHLRVDLLPERELSRAARRYGAPLPPSLLPRAA